LSWVPNKKRFVQFAVLVIAAGEISYAAAQVLVLRAVGPTAQRQYRPGQRLPDSARFTLRAGDSVVVLTRRGTRTFRGPGTFAATGPLRPRGSYAGRPARRVGTGAVRAVDGSTAVTRPENIWQYNIRESGRACVVQGMQPVLWRPSAAQSVQLTITPTAGQPRTVEWGAGQLTLNWPSDLPIADGASYQLSWPGGRPVRLTIEVVPPVAADNNEALATTFLENQCRGQLDVLIATRSDPEEIEGESGGGQ
jgi:hypothetical protein